MRNSYLQSLIKNISKKKGKLIYSTELKARISKLMQKEYTDTKAYKLMYYLKNKGYLISLKKNIFYIKDPESSISEEAILDQYYRQILYGHCKHSLEKKRYIGGEKALDLHYHNYEVPDSILIVNPDKQAKEMVVATKEVLFKKYSAKGQSFFPKFKKHTEKIKLGKHSFPIATKELALLECMYNYDDMFNKPTYLKVRKVIRRSTHLDQDRIAQIVKLGKHHTSINRLYTISKDVNKTFAEKLHAIIKKYSFFLDV